MVASPHPVPLVAVGSFAALLLEVLRLLQGLLSELSGSAALL